MSKPKTIFQKYKEIQKLDARLKLPWEVKRVLPDGASEVELCVLGDQIALGGDFVSLKEMRGAIAILVNELGGVVTWAE